MKPALLSFTLVSLFATHAASAQELPLTGPAFTIAEEAYKAYDRGDYTTAVRQAKEAIRLRPDVPRLHTLLRNAESALHTKHVGGLYVAAPTARPVAGNVLNEINQLQAEGKLEQALSLTQASLDKIPDINNELSTRKKILAGLLANQFSSKAIAAQQAGETDIAVSEILQSINYAPNVALYHLFYIDLLIKDKKFSEAETANLVALNDSDDQGMLHLTQAYLLQQRNQYTEARKHYIQAIQNEDLNDVDLDNMRLITADAALAENDPSLALEALSPMQEKSPEIEERRQFAYLSQAGETSFRPILTAPILRCIAGVPEPVCSFFASYPPSQLLITAAINATQTNQLEEAMHLTQTASHIIQDTPERTAERNTINRLFAQLYAIKTYDALAKNDLDLAEFNSRKAISYTPDNMRYHLLLATTLDHKMQYERAEQAVNNAIDIDDEDVVPLVLRGYFRQKQNHYQLARNDYEKALKSDLLSHDDMRLLRLYVSDAAASANDMEFAHEVLMPLPDKDPEVEWRRQLMQFYVGHSHDNMSLQAPSQDCRITPYGTACAIAPSMSSTDQLINVIYRQIGQKNYASAIQFATGLSARYPEENKYRYILKQAKQADEQEIASSRVDDLPVSYVPNIELAYAASMAKAPKQALQIFQDIEHANKLPPSGLQNTAYAAINANERPLASQYLRKTVDAVHDKKLALIPQGLFDTRRSVSELERGWGFYVAGSYRAGNTDSKFTNSTVSSDSLQIGTEGFWRPPSLVKDGRYVDIYGRITAIAYNKSGNTGPETLQAALGVRWKPFTNLSLITAFERQFPIGSATQGDWLARIADSYGKGTDLRVDVPDWFYSQVYAEAGYYLQAQTKYIVSEAQIGRSYRMDNWSKNTVLTPHAVLAADYNDGFSTPLAIGAGVGVNVRHWFREDRYHAPRSYFDLSIQYRFKLAGDSRANGIVIRGIFNY